jgi:hypothetical protein
MPGPWEKYQKPAETAPKGDAPAGPWTKYQVQAPAEPSLDERLSRGALNFLVEAGRKVDSVTGAPTRAAIGAKMEGKNPFKAFGSQFAEEPELAPTGRELAVKGGITDEKVLSTPFKDITGSKLILSPAQVAGTGIDILADPTTLVPPTKVVGFAAKGLAKAGGVVGREGFRAAGMIGRASLGKGATEVMRNKLASGFANIPEEKIAKYMAKDPEVLAKARPVQEVGRQVYDDAVKLQDEVSKGSSKSYEVLERAQGYLDGADVADIKGVAVSALNSLAVGQSKEGIGAAAKAGAREVQGVISDLDKAAGATPQFSFPDAKRILQNLDQQIKKAESLGDFDTPSTRALLAIRGAVREKLGNKVPEFNEVMKQVQSDTELLKELRGFGDLNTVTTRLKTAATEHRTRLRDQEVLAALGQRFGTDYLTETEDRLLLEAFGKDADRGSRYQNWGMGLGAPIGAAVGGPAGAAVGSALGGQVGLMVGKDAGAMTRRVLDATRNYRPEGPPTTEAISEALKSLRNRTPLETSAKGAQIFSTQDEVGGAAARRTAIRRRMQKEDAGRLAE